MTATVALRPFLESGGQLNDQTFATLLYLLLLTTSADLLTEYESHPSAALPAPRLRYLQPSVIRGGFGAPNPTWHSVFI